jgi:hypothetical protein
LRSGGGGHHVVTKRLRAFNRGQNPLRYADVVNVVGRRGGGLLRLRRG